MVPLGAFYAESFRVFRILYECAVDDLMNTYRGEYDPKALLCEKSQANDEIALLLSYREEFVLMLQIQPAERRMTYQWRNLQRFH